MDDYHPSFPSFEINEYAAKRRRARQRRRRRSKSLRKRKVWLAKMYGCKCYYCGKPSPLDTLTIDHRLPVSRGGSNAQVNTMLACHHCNNEKGSMTEEEYLKTRLTLSVHPSTLGA